MAGSESKPEGELIKKYLEKYLDDLNDKNEPLGKKTLAPIDRDWETNLKNFY